MPWSRAPFELGGDIVPEPVVVFRVLSPSTDRTDRIAKNGDCRTTPSIRRYVMVEQAAMAATVFARAGEHWIGHLLTGAAMLAMPEIGVELPLADFYAGAPPAAAG